MMKEIKNIIESLLLVAGEPLTIDRINNILTLAGKKEIRNALSELSKEYEARRGGFFLREVPIIRNDIEHVRGVNCGGILRMLLERRLIRVLGKKEIPGRPLIYATTKQFLEVFDLKDLKDLPTPEEIETLKEASSEHMR